MNIQKLSFAIAAALLLTVPNCMAQAAQQPEETANQRLFSAIFPHNEAKVKALLEEPAIDINMQDKEGETALFKAAVCGSFEIAEMLLKKGAQPDIAANDKSTALMEAAFNEDGKMMQLLLDYGADPDLKDEGGASARSLVKLMGRGDLLQIIHKTMQKRRHEKIAKSLKKILNRVSASVQDPNMWK